jgi:hypothetical protein
VVGPYLDPPETALVLCVDERSQIEALDRTAPSLPLLPTTPARRTHDLRPQRHHQPVRGAGGGQRQGHLGDPPPPPLRHPASTCI